MWYSYNVKGNNEDISWKGRPTPSKSLRDTGCSPICVTRKLVDDRQLTGEVDEFLYLNSSEEVPVAQIEIEGFMSN